MTAGLAEPAQVTLDAGDTLCQGTFTGRRGEYLCAADVEPGAQFCSAHPDQEGH